MGGGMGSERSIRPARRARGPCLPGGSAAPARLAGGEDHLVELPVVDDVRREAAAPA